MRGRFTAESVDDLRRNRWSVWAGIPTFAAGHGERTRGPVVPGRRRARVYGRSGEGAGGSRSLRRPYASASDTPSSHCGRRGAPRSGVSLRPQDGRGTIAAALASRFWRLGCRSSRQGCESRRVEVPLPPITRFRRLAYPLLGEVTN